MKAAFYEKDITPPLDCYLSGYYINHTAQDVLDTLYVRTSVLQSEGNTAIIIDIDSCEFPCDMHAAVTERIYKYTGIPKDCIMIAVNHTHKGIPIYDNPEIDAYADKQYKDVAYRLIADSAILAYRRLAESDGCFAIGKAEGISFNRTYIMKDGTFRTNPWGSEIERPLGEIDTEVPILFFKDRNGNPLGAIVSFACHQDCTPGSAYSGAFAHVLSEELKKVYGSNFVTVFLAGTSGDINHLDPKSNGKMPDDTYITMGKVLKESVIKAMENVIPIGEGIHCRKKLFAVPRRILTDEQALAEIKRMTENKDITAIRNLCYYHANIKDNTANVYLQYMKIGCTSIYAFPGEIFVYFGKYVKSHARTANNMIVSFTNTGCGYVATYEAFAENSHLYEKNLCIGACLSPAAGYMMTDELLKLAEE